MFGKNADGVISCMRDLTGQAPLFPLWTWGYWQSKERYASQNEIVDVVWKYRDLKVPLDGIIQDWRYWSMDNAYWNAIEFGNPEFPNPEKMMKDIHKLHAHAIISVWPSFGTKTKPYKEFKEKGLLFNFENFPVQDSVRVYNAFSPQAREIYWRYMNENIFSTGMDGWWLDATEPEHDNIKSSDFDQQTGIGTYRSVHNAFPLMTTTGVYNHQRNVTTDKRVYILTRSAFAGQQRNATCAWSGDVDGDWETLRKQLSAGLNFSLCGIPYWNTDIGGFWVRNEGSSAYADYRELYVRWLQFGAFSPMMRSHGTNTPREIWQFGQKGDSKVHDMSREYMYGSSFLVAPVINPFYTSGTGTNAVAHFNKIQKQDIYLPKGIDWYDFWTGEKFEGGQIINREIPIDILPLYVKAGSIIPFGPDVQYAGEKDWDNLEIRIYGGADASFVLYEDEKDNYNYEKGKYSTITMTWNNAERILTFSNRMGEFLGMLKKRQFRIVLIENNVTTEKAVAYKGKQVQTKIN